jgi:hypothetical protein
MPANRIVALLAGPVSTLAGLIAGYLSTHALGLQFGHDQIAKSLTFVLTAGVTAGIHYASAHKWLDGWQKYERLLLPATPLDPAPVAAPKSVRTPPTHPRAGA